MYAGRAGAANVSNGGYGGGGRVKNKGIDQEQDVHEELVKHFEVSGIRLTYVNPFLCLTFMTERI